MRCLLSLLLLCFLLKSHAQYAEALGTPIQSSNLLWNLHPANDPVNGRILPFFTKKRNGDIVSVLIDYKKVTELGVPLSKFEIVTVNTSANQLKQQAFAPAPGVTSPQTFGNLWRHFEGPDKKLYFCTVESGGALLQYDVEAETATNLGNPFLVNNKTLGIYSLAVGSDSAIYGGSYSNGIGDTYTFRYDPKNGQWWKYLTTIDNTLQYVNYVGGDAACNYVVCGQSTWVVYAIERSTNKITRLISSPNRIYDLLNTPCGTFAIVDGKRYALSATVATLTTNHCPPINFTLPYTDNTTPATLWNDVNSTYYYRFKDQPEQQLTLGVPKQSRKTLHLAGYHDSLIVGIGSAYSYTFDYRTGENSAPKLVGDNSILTVHSMVGNENSIYLAGYPSGQLELWDPSRTWTFGTQTLTYTPPVITSPESNPQVVANFRPDGKGIHTMVIAGIAKDGRVVVTGSNIRTDTSIAFGSYKNGEWQMLANAERFKDYVMAGYTMNQNKDRAYVLALKRHTWKNLVFVYNPLNNVIEDSFPIFETPIERLNSINMLPTGELFGDYKNATGSFIYCFDVVTKSITWQQQYITSSPLYSAVAPDNMLWFSTTPINPAETVFKIFNPYTKKITTGPTIVNPDEVSCNVTSLLFRNTDVYVGGYLNLIRIKSAVASPLQPQQPELQVQMLFNQYQQLQSTCN